MGVAKDSEMTCAKLVAAAGELFAEHGFHGVTVRDIVQKAQTHLSALNYHYAGKEGLYREVLTQACESPEYAQLDLEKIGAMPPRDALRQIIQAWLRDYTADASSTWKAKLIDRECLEPSPIFQEIVVTKIRPQAMFVATLLSRIVGSQPDASQTLAAVLGLIGQLNTLTLYRQLLDAVTGNLYDDLQRGDWLAEALTESTIAFAKANSKGNET